MPAGRIRHGTAPSATLSLVVVDESGSIRLPRDNGSPPIPDYPRQHTTARERTQANAPLQPQT